MKLHILALGTAVAFVGPMGFDVGKLLGELLLSFFSQRGHEVQAGGRDAYRGWILAVIEEVWTRFSRRFVELWDEHPTGDAYPRALFAGPDGSASLRRAIHEGFGDRLAYSCSVGGTHWDELAAKGASRELPGPKPTLFFAPAQASKRIEQWGAGGLQQRLAAAWVAWLLTRRGLPARAPRPGMAG